MELRHLRAFRAVAATSSFTKAAAELNYSQSTVTEQVQSLEAALGTALLDRSGRRPTLTPAGERLVAYADEILLLVERARADVLEGAGIPGGVLTISALETLSAHCLPRVLSRFSARYDEVSVTVRQGNRREVWDDVRQGRADVGLTFGEPPPDAALSRRSLYEDPLVAVLPSGHRLAREESVAPEDLATEPILATQPGCGFRGMLDARIDEWQGARVVAELASVAGVCGCVATGMGWALLPATAVESWVVRGELAAVPMRGAGFRTPVTVTWLRARENHPNITAFVDCAMAHARPVRIEEWPRAHVHDVA